jgi:TRAP-type C4-dicarboxylate transport system substrate-binding protein
MSEFTIDRRRMTGAILGATALAAGATLGAASASAAAEVTLRFHSHVPPVSTSFKTLKAWADKVEKDSGGRIKIQMFGAMQLGGKASDVYDQVKNGVVDIGWTLPGYKAGIFPAISVFELPFIAGSAPVVSPAVDEYARTVGAAEWKDVHPIVFHYAGSSVLHMKDKPVRKMEDFKGLKIRTPSRVSSGALQALGATPVPVPGTATMAEILMRDVVDGVVTPWGIARALKVVDVAKFHAENTLHGPSLVLIMNKDSYAKLPDDLKKVIDKNSGAEVSKWLGEQWEINDRPGRDKAKSLGHEVITISPAEEARWRKASQPVYDAWVKEMNAKGLDGAKLLSEAERLIAKNKAEAKKTN